MQRKSWPRSTVWRMRLRRLRHPWCWSHSSRECPQTGDNLTFQSYKMPRSFRLWHGKRPIKQKTKYFTPVLRNTSERFSKVFKGWTKRALGVGSTNSITFALFWFCFASICIVAGENSTELHISSVRSCNRRQFEKIVWKTMLLKNICLNNTVFISTLFSWSFVS